MRLELVGGVAVLTGAAAGIGRATALELARRGCHLALADRDAARLAEVAALARAHGVQVSEHALDVADAAAVAALPAQVLAAHGRVTLLVNNAGMALAGSFAEVTLDEFRWLIEINFLGAVALTKAFLPALLRQERAQIVNISSVFGIIAPAHQVAYAASKFALRGFSEALRHELAGTPVGVTVVHPGGVRTAIATSARVAAAADAATAATDAAAFTALLRTPPEAAAAAIVRAAERGAGRLLIGPDARLIDIAQRLLPATYWPLLQWLFARLGGRG